MINTLLFKPFDIKILKSVQYLISYVIQEKNKARDHSEIRKELMYKGLAENEVNYIMKQADHIYLDSLSEKNKTNPKEDSIPMGYIIVGIAIAGLIVLAYYFDLPGNFYIALISCISFGLKFLLDRSNKKVENSNSRFKRKL